MSTHTKNLTLPEGVSLRRVAEVLLDAWEVGSHQWKDTPLQLREGQGKFVPAPAPQDALELFRVLHERGISYVLVGGLAMLTYVQGRNTKDVDLLMSLESMRQIPELDVKDFQDWFVRSKFKSIQVDLLLTTNPLFKIVQRQFVTNHRFAELDVPAASVEGLILLKLYALPSLYRQFEMDRAALYENDITLLLVRHSPPIDPLLALLAQHVNKTDFREITSVLTECRARAERLRRRAGS